MSDEKDNPLPPVVHNDDNSEHSYKRPYAQLSEGVLRLDKKMADVPSNELQDYVEARKSLIEQDEYIKDREHIRKLEKFQIKSKIMLSSVAMLTGAGLVVAGFSLPGFLCLGAGLYWLAPNFVDSVTKRITFGGKNGID